jgi:16S rRNA C967 or C1407 C5-methylase (RsmB/RsmF family)/NOL1/NOP2/fmu family ribosome biogenesis protein
LNTTTRNLLMPKPMNELHFPEPFETRMRKQLGGKWNDFQMAHSDPPPISIRINPKKNCSIKTQGDVPWTAFGKYLSERPVFTLDPLFHAGTYYVQEASSMFLEQAIRQSVDLNKPINILDLCAAPGGKSTHILSLINKESLLVSNEVIRSRASILAENIQKWGNSNVVVTNNDPEDFQKLNGFFDTIVVDAPCSGEGLFRKDHEAIKEWSPENVALCSSRQKRILSDVWPALKENGVMIYCTCTYNESENEDNLIWLMNEHDIEFIEMDLDPHWGIEKITKNGVIGYRFFPHQVKGEGFFISIIRKKENAGSIRMKTKKETLTPSKKITESVKHWINESDQKKLLIKQDLLFSIPMNKAEEIEFISHHLKVISSGTSLAVIKHDKLIPEHALALAIELNLQAFSSINLSLEDAIRYLRKDSITLNVPEKGFCLVAFKNVPLGWVNILSNRVNNLYPSAWRIRMAG